MKKFNYCQLIFYLIYNINIIMFELEESCTRCVFCKDPNCSNPKSGFFIIDPDTLESNSNKIIWICP